MRRIVLIAALWLPALFLLGRAHGMELRARDGVIRATGQIEAGDAARFAALAGTTLIVTSNGGLIEEAEAMAETIRSRRMSVGVASQCDSACFLLLAAGFTRSVSPGSRVGVHSAKLQDGNESAAWTLHVARAAKALGATDEAIGRMVTTPANSIAYLTQAELAAMGVRIVP